MDKTTPCRQFQPEDRMTIASMQQQGLNVQAMVRVLSRIPSATTRESVRNTLTAMPYGLHTAYVANFSRREAARRTAKLVFSGAGWGVVRKMLDWKWSPRQIAATLKRVSLDDPRRHVSHETI